MTQKGREVGQRVSIFQSKRSSAHGAFGGRSSLGEGDEQVVQEVADDCGRAGRPFATMHATNLADSAKGVEKQVPEAMESSAPGSNGNRKQDVRASSGYVIRICHQDMSSGYVITICHQDMSLK